VRCCVSQKRDVGPRPPFICISQARSGTLIQISRTLWASKPECDAHICLNLGFTSQNFRLSQVPLRVCYFWLSSFRMDEGNPCLVSRGSVFVRILNGIHKRPISSRPLVQERNARIGHRQDNLVCRVADGLSNLQDVRMGSRIMGLRGSS
jgi:hypothetical protein